MISTYAILQNQIKQLDFLETDLQVHCEIIKDDRVYLETEAETYEENGDYAEAEKYYNELNYVQTEKIVEALRRKFNN